MPSIYTANGLITLETSLARYVIAHSGKVTEISDKRSGKNLLAGSDALFAAAYREHAWLERDIHADPARDYRYVAGPLMPTGAKSEPVQAITCDGNILTLQFSAGTLRLAVEVYDRWITFEALDDLPGDLYSVTLSDTPLAYDENDAESVCAVEYAMSIRMKPHFYPAPMEKNLRTEIFSKIGCKGAKFAIITAYPHELNDVMRRVSKATNPDKMIVSRAGGPFACDIPERAGSYTIITDVDNPDDLTSQLDKYRRFGITQVDLHQGAAFMQGDFSFSDKYQGKIETFREKVLDRLHADGFITGFHTYAQCIHIHCRKYVTDPHWQRQFEYLETLTLASGVGAEDTVLFTQEDASSITTLTGFRVKSSLYLLVGSEIIKFGGTGTDGVYPVERGVLGTKTVAHAKGETIRHLANMFGFFIPQLDSELYLEIARNTAKAYNAGGFFMMYQDALDSVSMFDEKFGWYYAAKFIHEIVKHCDRDPMLEYSVMYPLLWYSRTRCGAWDVPKCGYRRFIDEHIRFNTISPHSYMLGRQLGWMVMYPPVFGEDWPGKQIRFMFPDDVDLICARAIAYDHGMSCQYLEDNVLRRYPAMARNMERFSLFERFRLSGYFTEEEKAKLRNLDKEFVLIDEKGKYNLAEYSRVYGKLTSESRVLKGHNPYHSQQPYLRIEPLWTDGGDPLLLSEQETTIFNPTLDLSDRPVFRARVRGNGSDDEFLLEVMHPRYRSAFRAYYRIPLNFTGERDVILAESDNGDFPNGYFEGHSYSPYRDAIGTLFFDSIESIRILKHGSCEGAGLYSINAVKCIPTVLENPTLISGEDRLTFSGSVRTGEYLEYSPSKGAYVYDVYGNSQEIAYLGSVKMKNGSFTIELQDGLTEKARALVTAGFAGKCIKE